MDRIDRMKDQMRFDFTSFFYKLMILLIPNNPVIMSKNLNRFGYMLMIELAEDVSC
jgi:hypothetical protein